MYFTCSSFLDLPYQLDVEELNKQYARPIKGSHLLLFLPPGGAERSGLTGYCPVFTNMSLMKRDSFSEETQ